MQLYDSTKDTLDHIEKVINKMKVFVDKLYYRAIKHDQSKLHSPEKELFDKMTPILKGLEYGSDEYKKSLEELKPALEHHYKNNRHHPEYHEKGIDGMDLLDIVEMFCDWMAATERTKDGDIVKSIEINKKRFGMSDQLTSIFMNTLKYYKGDKDAR